MTKGLVQGEGFAIDVSITKADANRARSVPDSEFAQWRRGNRCSRTVRVHLEALDLTNPVADDSAEGTHDTRWRPAELPADPDCAVDCGTRWQRSTLTRTFLWIDVNVFDEWVLINRLVLHFDPCPFTFLLFVVAIEAVLLAF